MAFLKDIVQLNDLIAVRAKQIVAYLGATVGRAGRIMIGHKRTAHRTEFSGL